MPLTDTRKGALDLAAAGFRVFPCHGVAGEPGRLRCSCGNPDCRDVAKHPIARFAPRGLHSATRDVPTIERWFRTGAPNVGVVTGEKAVIIDIDPRHDGDETLAKLELQHGPLPPTWRVYTGGNGQHLYFQAPIGLQIQNSANRVGPGVDVRGRGGYVIGPPSRHASGREYCWDVDGYPGEVPLAPMPEWLIEACGAQATGGAAGPRFDAGAYVGERLVEGSRNAKLTSLCGHLLRRFVDPYLVAELVGAYNDAKCVPPLTPAEVGKIVESIAGRELRRRQRRAA